MEHPSPEEAISQPVNGGATVPTVALLPCPLESLPQELHAYIHALENRIVILETEQKRFSDALKNAGNFIFNSPQGKMISMAFPKEMQEGLRKYFNGNI